MNQHSRPPALQQTSLPAFHNIAADATAPSISALPTILTGLAILLLFLAGIVVWSVYVPLHAAVHASGELVFQSKRQNVQHLEGGIIKKILIRDGDMVQAGQPLLILESKQVQPLVNMVEEQSIAEIAYSARLETESKDLPSIMFPALIMQRAHEPGIANIIRNETKLFNARRESFQHQIELLRLQLAQIKESAKGTQDRLGTKAQEIASIKEQLNANQSLLKEGYVSKTIVLDLQRILAEKTGDRETITATVATDQQRIAELEQRILSLKSERIQGAINELKQSALRRIDLQERARPMRDTLDRQVIRAPVTGRVVGLKVATVGGVIMPRDTLMEIVPTGDQLRIEARVGLENVTDIFVGQTAEVMISGLDSRKTPSLQATVTYLSDDRITPQTTAQGQQPYYAAYLDFDQKSLKALGGTKLMPGMTASVAIATKPRTPFDYLFEPFKNSVKKALQTK